ncbi:hypothetical protein GCM10020331_073530 [Ectobacillus funiculus]
MEEVQDTLLLQAIQEGFIADDTVAIDATHFESRDQATPQEKKTKGRAEKNEVGNQRQNRKHFKQRNKKNKMNRKRCTKKTIADQLDMDLETLRTTVPIESNWGIKKKIVKVKKTHFWFGFKAHLAIGSKS